VPIATTPWLRLLGLGLLDAERAPAGLLIPRCRSVHTFGMRFEIDVLFLGGDRSVLRLVEAVGPGRLLTDRTSTQVLEIRNGGSRVRRAAPVGHACERRCP